MDILENVYRKIMKSFPEVPPENGGILGIRDGIVCQYYHDKSNQILENAIYVPDIRWMNWCIQEWEDKQISFGGIVHSHMPGQKTLSNSDKKYIKQIINGMPGYIKELYFPIIIPQEEIICYRAYKHNQNLVLEEDEIHIICGGIENKY